MAYTRVWNEAFPPDTQAANQLGNDIRQAKVDLRERMTFSGLLGNRPTPEASFAGLIYLATDVAKLYRWSGTAWVDITSSVSNPLTLYRGGVVQKTGVLGQQQVYNYLIPANTVGPLSMIEFEYGLHLGVQNAGTGSYWWLYLGSTVPGAALTLQQYGPIKVPLYMRLRLRLTGVGANSYPQWIDVKSDNAAVYTGFAGGQQTMDFTQDQTVTVVSQLGITSDLFYFDYFTVTLWK